MVKTYIQTEKRPLGVLLIISSTLCFGMMQISAAFSRPQIGVMEQTFFSSLAELLLVGIVARRAGVSFFGTRQYQLQLSGRSLSGFCAMIALFYAVRHASQADVTVITHTSMFTIAAASALILREKLTKIHYISMAAAFSGAFIAAGPSFVSAFWPLMSAFGNALCCTLAYVLLSYFSGRVNPLTVIMHFCMVTAVVSFPLMLPDFVMPAGLDWLHFAMVGFSGASAQICVTWAYRMAPAGELSIYSQLSLVTTPLLAWAVLEQTPNLNSAAGAAVTLAASLALFLSKQRN